MGSKKIEVSRLGRIVSANVRAQLGIRHMSNRELARKMGRGETYVRARVNDEKEWTINDLEILGELWGLSPAQLVVPITGVEAIASPSSGVDVSVDDGDDGERLTSTAPSGVDASVLAAVAAQEERKRDLVLAKLRRGDAALAAYEDSHKLDPDMDE